MLNELELVALGGLVAALGLAWGLWRTWRPRAPRPPKRPARPAGVPLEELERERAARDDAR